MKYTSSTVSHVYTENLLTIVISTATLYLALFVLLELVCLNCHRRLTYYQDTNSHNNTVISSHPCKREGCHLLEPSAGFDGHTSMTDSACTYCNMESICCNNLTNDPTIKPVDVRTITQMFHCQNELSMESSQSTGYSFKPVGSLIYTFHQPKHIDYRK